MCQIPLVTCIPLHYTKIMVNFDERPQCRIILPTRHVWAFLSDNDGLHCFVQNDWWTSERKIASVRYTNLHKTCWLVLCEGCPSLTMLCLDDDEGATKALSSSLAGAVHTFVHSSQTLPQWSRFYGNFQILRNPERTEHAQTRLFFLCPRTRAWKWGLTRVQLHKPESSMLKAC